MVGGWECGYFYNFLSSFSLALMFNVILSIHKGLQMRFSAANKWDFHCLQKFSRTVVLGRFGFKFLSNIIAIKFTGLLWLLPS